MQTAVGVFGGDGQSQTDGIDAHPSLTATATVNCPPIVAIELCRERLVRTLALNWYVHKNQLHHTCIILLTAASSAACRGFIHVTREEASASITLFSQQSTLNWQVAEPLSSNSPIHRIELRRIFVEKNLLVGITSFFLTSKFCFVLICSDRK